MLSRWLAVVACLFVAVLCSAVGHAQEEFAPLFDGHSLDNWRGQDMSFWSVEDGAITGTIAMEHAPKLNQYLVWQGGLLDDFDLRLVFRLAGSTTPDTNGGFQFRSRLLPNGDVAGYQVDNNFGQPWMVRLYDEFGRHDLAIQGERATFDRGGRRDVESLSLTPDAVNFRLNDWHEYRLVAQGQKLTLYINNRLVAEAIDHDNDNFERTGILALQLHTGPPMKAQFKDIRLKKLPMEIPLSARERLLADAALHWELGRRLDAHQPPLKAVGSITSEVKADGAGARQTERVAQLDNAYFDLEKDLNTPRLWNIPADAVTVHLRARVPDGRWDSGLFSKRGSHDRVNFNLFSTDLPDTSGPDIGFEIHTDGGFFMVSFPVDRIDLRAWHDLTGRYDGTQLQIFCDGKLMASQPATGRLTANDELILIGAETDRGEVVRPFTGELSSASIWSRALKDEELQSLVLPSSAD